MGNHQLSRGLNLYLQKSIVMPTCRIDRDNFSPEEGAHLISPDSCPIFRGSGAPEAHESFLC